MHKIRLISLASLVVLILVSIAGGGSAAARTRGDGVGERRSAASVSTSIQLAPGPKRDALVAATGSSSVQAAGSSTSLQGDFDNNGRGDLVVGVPGEDSGAGAVEVIYGKAAGLAAAGSQFLHESDNFALIDEAGDGFGSSLAVGDFNGDGFTDLAVGAPGEDFGFTDQGIVAIYAGSPTGLNSATFFEEADVSSGDGEEDGDGFGTSLTAGNFGAGGQDDLAIGSPSEDVGALANAGSVAVLYGSPTGLTTSGNQTWTQDSGLVEGIAEAGDDFGFSLASGNFGATKHADLAIGVPGESVGESVAAGAVNVLYGSSTGLLPFGDQMWTQDSEGIRDTSEEDDLLGWSLAAGNFGRSGQADLAAGAFLEDVGTAPLAGSVSVIYGAAGGLTATGNQFWSQDSKGIAEKSEFLDEFGFSLSAGNVGKSSQADLVLGVPDETLGGTLSGAVNVIYGSSKGLVSAGNQLWSQDSIGIKDAGEAGDVFGYSVSAVNYGKSTQSDLAVGVPGEDLGSASAAGAVNVIYGTSTGLTKTGNQIWSQNSPGIADTAETDDNFGLSVA